MSENLYNPAHKCSNPDYRDNYDRIFGKKEERGDKNEAYQSHERGIRPLSLQIQRSWKDAKPYGYFVHKGHTHLGEIPKHEKVGDNMYRNHGGYGW